MITIALFFSACMIIMFGIIGLIVGWLGHEYFVAFVQNKAGVLFSDHPEMYDENGNPIQAELYSVRFEEEEDEED